ncbi:MAG: hypothetical protein JRF51_04630 [Deltaproteobacteria bacterium]|nr:hypothetical protein [Deltaproteobacteria bacterium]HDZ91611.1 hypothetical protein [Deltaproteobacteria bacterium]
MPESVEAISQAVNVTAEREGKHLTFSLAGKPLDKMLKNDSAAGIVTRMIETGKAPRSPGRGDHGVAFL